MFPSENGTRTTRTGIAQIAEREACAPGRTAIRARAAVGDAKRRGYPILRHELPALYKQGKVGFLQ